MQLPSVSKVLTDFAKLNLQVIKASTGSAALGGHRTISPRGQLKKPFVGDPSSSLGFMMASMKECEEWHSDPQIMFVLAPWMSWNHTLMLRSADGWVLKHVIARLSYDATTLHLLCSIEFARVCTLVGQPPAGMAEAECL